MNLTQNNQNRFLRLVAGWCGMVFYVGACSPVGLGLAALVGSLACDHQLQVHPGAQGLQLLLHHGANCVVHHHGLAARALMVFAQPSGPTTSDHVLEFSSADNFKSESETSLSKSKPSQQALFYWGWDGSRHSVPVIAVIGSPISVLPSPDESAAQLCLRSTILLI